MLNISESLKLYFTFEHLKFLRNNPYGHMDQVLEVTERETERERERALEAIEKREKTGDGRAWFVVLVLVPVEVGSDDQ